MKKLFFLLLILAIIFIPVYNSKVQKKETRTTQEKNDYNWNYDYQY